MLIDTQEKVNEFTFDQKVKQYMLTEFAWG